MTSAIRTEGQLAISTDSDRRNYQRAYRLTFVFFLAIVLVGRLLPAGKQSTYGHHEPDSVMDEARRMSSTILPFLFLR